MFKQYCPSPNTQVRVADTPSVLGAVIGQRHTRLCRQAQTQRTSLFAEPDLHMIRGPEYLQLGNLQENSTEETYTIMYGQTPPLNVLQ